MAWKDEVFGLAESYRKTSRCTSPMQPRSDQYIFGPAVRQDRRALQPTAKQLWTSSQMARTKGVLIFAGRLHINAAHDPALDTYVFQLPPAEQSARVVPILEMLFLRVLTTLILLLSAHASAKQFQFQFFGGFKEYFDSKLQASCRQEYITYLDDPRCPTCHELDDYAPFDTDRAEVSLVNCLLNDTDEYVKANTAAGTVILGLLPTILSFSGSTTTEVGLLALRRPFLATLLALSSPSIYPVRALDYEDPVAVLRPGRAPFTYSRAQSTVVSRIASLVQYIFALAATANVATQIWALCVKGVSSIGVDFQFYPMLWPLTTLFMHMLGYVYVALRVQLNPSTHKLMEKVNMEFTPSAAHEGYTPPVHPQTLLSGFFAWLASVLTICNIIFGTLVLSSLLFISAADAVFVTLRLWASTVVARIIIMYELSGMSLSLNIPS